MASISDVRRNKPVGRRALFMMGVAEKRLPKQVIRAEVANAASSRALIRCTGEEGGLG
jgi:hypothetical protein